MGKFETKINKVGKSVPDFFGEKMLILFGDNAPVDLADFCVLIDINDVKADIEVGDVLTLGTKEYAVTAVGNAVKTNLSSLGHITLKFDGSTTAELPGTLYLEESELSEVNVGDAIKIASK